MNMLETRQHKVVELVSGTMPEIANDTEVPVVHAEALFGRGKQVTIRHAGEAYILTCTKQNKLLLTKPAANGTVDANPCAKWSTGKRQSSPV